MKGIPEVNPSRRFESTDVLNGTKPSGNLLKSPKDILETGEESSDYEWTEYPNLPCGSDVKTIKQRSGKK